MRTSRRWLLAFAPAATCLLDAGVAAAEVADKIPTAAELETELYWNIAIGGVLIFAARISPWVALPVVLFGGLQVYGAYHEYVSGSIIAAEVAVEMGSDYQLLAVCSEVPLPLLALIGLGWGAASEGDS